MNKPSWSNILNDVLTGRVPKPRISGLTMVIDTGLPLTMMRDILQLSANHIDFWKFAFGSAAVCPAEAMAAKVALCQEYGVQPYAGGTSLEIAVAQGIWKEYMDALWDGGIRVLEVSDGTIEVPPRQRRDLVRTARKMGFTVLTEVGKKRAGYRMAVPTLAQSVQNDLNNGAQYVIVEGREGGRQVGVFDEYGHVREDDVKQLVQMLGPLATRLIWEAPLAEQQVYYVKQFGHKVNLGNIQPTDIVKLESLRRGLRSDTMRVGLGLADDEPEELPQVVPEVSDNAPPPQRNVIDVDFSKPTLWTGANTERRMPSSRVRKDDARPM